MNKNTDNLDSASPGSGAVDADSSHSEISRSKPLVIDLFCGRGGWSRGFLAEGYDAIGFDIERHSCYPGQLVLQDVATLDGRQFRGATVIVASPPCQAYSYRAMPWKRAKALPPPSNELFDACFRIAREAGCPLVVENVKGAQPWVGRAKAHFGSFYLWGDIESVGGAIVAPVPKFGQVLRAGKAQKFNPDGTKHGQGSWFKIADSKERGARKNEGGSWFAVAHNTESGHSQNARDQAMARKGTGGSWFTPDAEDRTPGHWKEAGCVTRIFNSKDPRRKEASAAIAEIPFDLAQWVARCFKPPERAEDTASSPATSESSKPLD